MRSGVAAAALLAGTTLASAGAHAQNTTTVIPSPGIERYSLPPGNSQATPAPTPTPAPIQTPSAPTPTLTPAPPPSVVPTLQIPRTTPTPSPTSAPPVTRAPVPQRAPTTSGAPAAAPTVTPVAQPTATPPGAVAPSPLPEPALPAPVAVETPAPSAAAPIGGPPNWLWWAIGLAVLVIAGFAAWRWSRSRAQAEAETDVYEAEPAPQPVAPPPPTPSPPARRVAGTPAVAPQPDRALTLDFRPQRLWTRGPDAFLAFELVVTNTGSGPVDAVRPVIALASGGPDTAAEIAAFNADAPTLPGGEPFALRVGETRSVTGELTLPGDSMYVTTAANRELIVPIALVSLGWRAGVSLARAADAFIIGTGDATTPRLGPIWVDRAGLVYAKLDARRFTPGPR